MEARRRGVVFDIGHGGGSFGFRTAERMLEAGFLPDVISSDVHALSVDGPAFDQLVTMSKFLALGVELGAVIRASTSAPAAALGRSDLGHLAVGALGDASVLELAEGEFDFKDVLGETRRGTQRLQVQPPRRRRADVAAAMIPLDFTECAALFRSTLVRYDGQFARRVVVGVEHSAP